MLCSHGQLPRQSVSQDFDYLGDAIFTYSIITTYCLDYYTLNLRNYHTPIRTCPA